MAVQSPTIYLIACYSKTTGKFTEWLRIRPSGLVFFEDQDEAIVYADSYNRTSPTSILRVQQVREKRHA
jgi:hypothetical protein